MKNQIEKLKIELREFIKLSKIYMNVSPAMAECLLVAVEGYESLSRRVPFMGSTGEFREGQLDGIGAMAEQARIQLQQILNIWEAAK